VDQCQPLKKFLPKLAKLQRRMAGKEKFSKCGFSANADFVAAVHIREAGLALASLFVIFAHGGVVSGAPESIPAKRVSQ
jgi:citrate synthase